MIVSHQVYISFFYLLITRSITIITTLFLQSGNNSDVSEKCILLDFVSDGQIVIDIHIEATWVIK